MKRPEGPDPLARVREARHQSTPAERRLWSRLRSRQLAGLKFRRHVWLGPFIADFFCAEAHLVIEVDGDTHALQEAYDRRRTEWLERAGYSVVRFGNSDVMNNIEGVLEHLMTCIPSPSRPASRPGPSLSPSGRGPE